MNWIQAYTYKTIQTGKWWWKQTYYQIEFDGSPLFSMYDIDQAQVMTLKLNAAYNSGYQRRLQDEMV